MVKVYIDTSVVVALSDSSDNYHGASLNFVAQLRGRAISSAVGPPFFLEVAKAAERRGAEAARRLVGYPVEHGIELGEVEDDRLWSLKDEYVASGAMTERRTLDLLHYASATLLSCTHLASWDGRHFNEKIGKRINRVNVSRGLSTLIVGSPFVVSRRLRVE